jgi:hypothetical protein
MGDVVMASSQLEEDLAQPNGDRVQAGYPVLSI